MEINRVELLSILKLVAPALASNKNTVAELSHFWFDGKTLSAFDDLIGITVSLKTDFTGGVLGDKLLGILENSRAKNIRMTREDDGSLLIKAGSAFVTFALRPIEEWFFDESAPSGKSFRLSKELLDAMKLTLMSVGSAKILSPEQRGITIIQNGSAADLYTTDAVSMSWMKVPTKDPLLSESDRVVVPTEFCNQVIKVMGPGADLFITKEAAYCIGDVILGQNQDTKVEVYLFAKLVVEEDDIVPFEETRDSFIQKTKNPFPIPERLKLALERALVFLGEGQAADLSVDKSNKGKDVLQLRATTPTGEVDDELVLEKAENHGKVSARIDASLIKRGMDGREHMAMTDEILVMTGPEGFYHFITTK